MENIPDRYFFLPPVDSQQYMGDPVAESVSANHRKIDSRDRVFGGPFSGCFLQCGIGEQLHLFSKDGQDFARHLGHRIEPCRAGLTGLEIRDRTIAAQAGVIGNVRQSGQKLFGSPAIDIKNYMRSYAIFKQNGK